MIAADTCSLIAFFRDENAADVNAVDAALKDSELAISPVILAEALSDPSATHSIAGLLSELFVLELQEGYWLRVAQTRKKLRARGLKSKLGDALIAQSCIDHNVPLITRDKDFRHYAIHCGLKLYA